MKKINLILILISILTSCGTEEVKTKDFVSIENQECKSGFKIGKTNKTTLKLKGVIVDNDIKTISSPMAGNIDYLNCEAGREVSNNTLIAKISPDFNNPNTINLSIQKGSLINQRINLQSVKASTITSFDIQISSSENQILDIKEQLKIIEKNISLTKQSTKISKNDLENQTISLQETLVSSKNNLELLLKAKQEALEKIDISKETLITNIESITGDNLLKIDEIFGISKKNKDLNNKYQDYLSAKNSGLKNKVKNEFIRLNLLAKTINTLDDKELSIFLGDLIQLDKLTRDAIKESIANIYLTQIQIDSYYSLFLNYSNNISPLKDTLDSLGNLKSSTNTTFATQVSSLENQIATSETTLKNLEKNKLDSVDIGLDLKLSELNSQTKTLESNLKNLISGLANIKSTKKTQVLNLDNQILQIKQSIDSLNTNLSTRSLYSKISGIIKQKVSYKGNSVGMNTPICHIIPDTNSTKVKIYSPIELNIGEKLDFDFNGEKHEIVIENVLVYKDIATQNYIYESNYLNENKFKDGEILNLNFKDISNSEILSEETIVKKDNIIKIPVSYVRNKIDGNYVQINTLTGILEKEVELGDINGDYIEIKSGLKNISEVCK